MRHSEFYVLRRSMRSFNSAADSHFASVARMLANWQDTADFRITCASNFRAERGGCSQQPISNRKRTFPDDRWLSRHVMDGVDTVRPG